MKPTPHGLAVNNLCQVTQAATAKQKAADHFRQRMIDQALRRVLKVLVNEEADHADRPDR